MPKPQNLPPGIDWRPELCDRPDLCPAYSTSLGVHCAEPVDPQTQAHVGEHWGAGFPARDASVRAQLTARAKGGDQTASIVAQLLGIPT